MPRPPKIMPHEWDEIRRRIVEGEAYSVVARDYGVTAAAIRNRIVPAVPGKIEDVARAIVAAEEGKAKLTTMQLIKAESLARVILETNSAMMQSAKLNAGTALRMAQMANEASEKIDPIRPSAEEIKAIAVMIETSNRAAVQPIDLLKMNSSQLGKEEEPQQTIDASKLSSEARRELLNARSEQ